MAVPRSNQGMEHGAAVIGLLGTRPLQRPRPGGSREPRENQR